jgi:type IV fimbrial biogenesis protein FimT
MTKSLGLTLIECLLSLFLLSMLFMSALPSVSGLLQKNQMQVLQDDLKSAIFYARSQALIRNQPILLTPLSETNDWSEGITVFVDNETHRYASDSEILFQWHWSYSDVRVTYHGFQANQALRFVPEISQNAVNGYFLIQNQYQQGIKVVINRFGRVRIERA